MANVPQGGLRFAGIWADGEFSVTRSGSTKPDQIHAQFILGANLPQYGDIEVWYGQNFIRIPYCRVVRQQISGGADGRMREVTFEDSRWLWRYQYGFGNTNLRRKIFGSWYVTYKASKKLIVQNFLQLLGFGNVSTVPPEALFDFNTTEYGSVLEDDAYFEANHFDGKPIPDCLEEVLQPMGVQVHLGWDNQVRLFSQGYGRDIPNDQRVMDYTISITPPVVPEVLVYEFANVNFENDFVLRAVGYEWDERKEKPTKRLAPLDQLSYGPIDPATGKIDWRLADPPNFSNIKNKKLRELCRRTIFKLYRIDSTKKLDLVKPVFQNVPPKSNIQYDESDFILHDALWVRSPGLLETDEWKQWGVGRDYQRILFDEHSDDDMKLIGFFCDQTVHQKNNNAANVEAKFGTISSAYEMNGTEFRENTFAYLNKNYPEICYQKGFSFDADNMLIQLDDRLVWINRNNAGEVQNHAYYPAKLIMRCRHKLRRRSDMEVIRHMVPVQINSPYSAPGVVDKIRIEDPVHVAWGVPQRFDALKQKLSTITAQYMATKRMTEAATIPMKGFCFDINTDGRIASVTFQRSGNGACTTTVQWQNENPVEQPTYQELVNSAIKQGMMSAYQQHRTKQSAKIHSPAPRRHG